MSTRIAVDQEQEILRSESNGESLRSSEPRFTSAAIPTMLAVALYVVNNLGVLHALFAAPNGYVAIGVDRDLDVAMYITWIRGLTHQWIIPDYHAAWRTEPGLAVPAMAAIARLSSWSGLSVVMSLHVFQLLTYVLTAYAAAFALRTFCDTRREKLAALVVAIACVPIRSVLQPAAVLLHRPDWQRMGAQEFLAGTDGFFRGITNWPLLTFGAFTVALALPLTAHYLLTRRRKWLWFLAADCLLSAFLHPFEIIPIAAAVTMLFLRCRSERWGEVAFDIGTIGAASVAGMSIYVAQTLRYPWIREVSSLNHYAALPAQLLSALGIPVLIGILLLLLGFPRREDIKATVLKVWFVMTLVVAYAPKMPWSLHFFDGFYFVVGLLVMYQARDLVQAWRLSFPTKLRRPALALVACILIAAVAPHFTFRWVAWSDGIRTTDPIFCSAIALRDESLLIDWFRKNSSPDSLVLAPRDQAPWIATAPIHSFGSHWLCSLLTPWEEQTRAAFYSGELRDRDASVFLEKYGFSFVVIPSRSPAVNYIRDGTQLVARIGDFEIFKGPNAGMRERAEIRAESASLEQRPKVQETAAASLRQ